MSHTNYYVRVSLFWGARPYLGTLPTDHDLEDMGRHRYMAIPDLLELDEAICGGRVVLSRVVEGDFSFSIRGRPLTDPAVRM